MPSLDHARPTSVHETDSEKIARLEAEVKASRTNNYLLQQAATRVVWNNDHLREAMAAVVREIGRDPQDPLLASISGRLSKAISTTLEQ